jgi:prevent-host-death family protein
MAQRSTVARRGTDPYLGHHVGHDRGCPMTTYSVADAKNRLPALIAAAERGESVTITRYGKPVAELRAVAPAPRRRMTPEEWDALFAEVDALGIPPLDTDAATLVRRMRDEEDAP